MFGQPDKLFVDTVQVPGNDHPVTEHAAALDLEQHPEQTSFPARCLILARCLTLTRNLAW